jgi:hypothetical protein
MTAQTVQTDGHNAMSSVLSTDFVAFLVYFPRKSAGLSDRNTVSVTPSNVPTNRPIFSKPLHNTYKSYFINSH